MIAVRWSQVTGMPLSSWDDLDTTTQALVAMEIARGTFGLTDAQLDEQAKHPIVRRSP